MLGERLAKARRLAGLAQVDLAVAMGDRYNGPMISMVENNHSGLLLDGAVKAAQELNVSLDYLVGLTDDPTPAAELANKVNHPEFRHLPIRDARGGMGPEAYVEDDPIIGYLAFRTPWLTKHGINPDNASMIEAVGDSMEPTIKNGAMVLVDHHRHRLKHDHIFAVRTEDGVLIKRAARVSHQWKLVSDNSGYAPLPFSKNDRVIGEVRWAGRTL